MKRFTVRIWRIRYESNSSFLQGKIVRKTMLNCMPVNLSLRSLLIFLIAAIFFVFLIISGWRPLFIDGLIPMDGNMFSMSFPNWQVSRSFLISHRIPLWNPYRNMGEPLLADPQTMASYPVFWITLPLKRFIDFLRSWVVIHTLLSACFIGMLSFKLYHSRAGGFSAAIVAGLNGFFAARIMLPNHFAAAAWLPAALYFQTMLSPAGLGLSLALQWLSGFPPFFLLSVLAVFIVSLHQGREGIKCFSKAGLIAAGLSAYQWMPFLELMMQTPRKIFLRPDAAIQYSIPFIQLLKQLFIPLWAGIFPKTFGDPTVMTFYTGIMALAVALWSAIYGTNREKRIVLAVLATLILSLGNAIPFYNKAKLFHIFRFPANWLLLSSMGIAILCSYGISRMHNASWRYGVAAIIALELLLFAQYPRITWVNPAFLTEPPDLLSKTGEFKYPVRIYHTDMLMDKWIDSSLEKKEDYLLMRYFLPPSYGTAFGLQEVSSYQVLATRLAYNYQQRLATEGPSSPLLKWAGVAAVITSDADAGRLSRKNIKILLTKNVLPRVFIKQDIQSDVELLRYDAGYVDARVRSSDPCTLVLSEVNYPGWKVIINGKKTMPSFFEETFIAVSLPEGEHSVIFSFDPVSFKAGLIITLLAISVLLYGIYRQKF
ncbi:YfhO family protein [bacterium]|nr:YfhO family protein [bacterium]